MRPSRRDGRLRQAGEWWAIPPGLQDAASGPMIDCAGRRLGLSRLVSCQTGLLSGDGEHSPCVRSGLATGLKQQERHPGSAGEPNVREIAAKLEFSSLGGDALANKAKRPVRIVFRPLHRSAPGWWI